MIPTSPGDRGTVHIDSSGVKISHVFRDKWNAPLTHYEFSLNSGGDSFVETVSLVGDPSHGGHEVRTSGKCIAYK